MSKNKSVPFYDNWLELNGMATGSGEDHQCNLTPDFFTNLYPFNDKKLKKWRIEAAKRCAETLGPFPALCFSGGVDSQAMLQCWSEADLEAHVVIFRFNNDLNIQDADHAIQYCRKFSIPYREIEIDILKFLTRDNVPTTQKYGNISPHFNTHYRFVEILTHMGYTGVCFGGFAPMRTNNEYGNNMSKALMYWAICGDKFDVAVQGSFLSFSPELTWALTLSTPETFAPLGESTELRDYETQKLFEKAKYDSKMIGYRRCGFDLMPQSQKYTGFELVKDHYAELTGDGWAFERQFRFPLRTLDNGKYNKDMHHYKIGMTPEQLQAADSVYLNHFPPSD